MKRALLACAATLALATAAMRPAAAFAAPSAAEETIHAVKAGETLDGIANRAGVTSSAIAKTNGLKPPYVLKTGQKLAIPRPAPGKPAAAKAAPAKAGGTKPKAAASSTSSAETETVHVVQPGETLGGIANRTKVPRVLIIEANGLQPPYAVRTGQKLQIPRTRRHSVAAGDTGFAVSMQYGVPWEQVALANNLDPAAPLKPGQTLLIPTLLTPPPPSAPKVAAPASTPAPAPAPAAAAPQGPRFGWPVSGPVRRGYAAGSDYHDGIDITAAKGTMVRAAAGGTVKFAGHEKDQFGNLVVIDHGDGWFTAYGFLSRITVKEGAKVAAGERIGLVGDTGMAKGTELHFEIRRDGKPRDPLGDLPKAP